MTAPNPQQNPSSPSDAPASPAPPPSVVVHPTDNSRLDQLAAEYALLQPKAQETTERLEEIKAGIKAELQRAQPGVAEVLLTSPHLAKPLRLKWVPEGWVLDSKLLKAQDPETFVTYAKKRKAYWDLRAVS